MAETLSTLSIVAFAVAGVALLLAVFFWFFFKIPSVIGDLTGRTAKKSIANMRAANEKTGAKGYRGSKINAERGKLTETIPHEQKQKAKQPISGTQQAADPTRPETGVLAANRETGFVSEPTGLLPDTETTGLLVDEDATAPLAATPAPTPKNVGGKSMILLEEVMLIHTDEVIE